MIRQWFIVAIVSLAFFGLLWNFYTEVVVYNPMDTIELTDKESQGPQVTEAGFKPAWGKEIVSRNLFSSDRGYKPKPTPRIQKPVEIKAPPPPPPTPPKVILSGIILNQYGEYIAIIQQADGKIKRVREGDVFDGIQVVEIRSRSVKLAWKDQDMTLSMKKIHPLQR